MGTISGIIQQGLKLVQRTLQLVHIFKELWTCFWYYVDVAAHLRYLYAYVINLFRVLGIHSCCSVQSIAVFVKAYHNIALIAFTSRIATGLTGIWRVRYCMYHPKHIVRGFYVFCKKIRQGVFDLVLCGLSIRLCRSKFQLLRCGRLGLSHGSLLILHVRIYHYLC